MKPFWKLRNSLTWSRLWRRLLVWLGFAAFGSGLFLFISFRYLHLSTNSAVVHLLKDGSGYHLSTDISFDQLDSLVFSIDATPFLNGVLGTAAAATNGPIMDINFDSESGKGVIKEFRPDGSRLEIALSRFADESPSPHGVVVGGDFPMGDGSDGEAASGMAFYDGKRWVHLWCNANEGIGVARGGPVYEPHDWQYLSGRIVKKNFDEVIVESVHSVRLAGSPLEITRRMGVKAGNGFATLLIKVTNNGRQPVIFDYAYGDEPWLGEFGSSEGDVGWFEGGLVTREAHIDPGIYSTIGFTDMGNPEAGEGGSFTGFSNYIQWLGQSPTEVYFSDDFYSVQDRVIASPDNRLLNIVWKDQVLHSGQSKTFRLRIGFLNPNENIFAFSRKLKAI